MVRSYLFVLFSLTDPDPIKVANNGYISYTLMDMTPARTETDLILMRFRTTKQDGVLLYADGNQGDFLAVELKRGYLHFTIDLGMSSLT